ncbi:MAG: hypothetical protein HS126_35505 [Anaerolineales bacterium]|nr:hypothetical protein [Anaerolineales bacterium]
MADIKPDNNASQENKPIYLAQYDNWPGLITLEGSSPQPITAQGEVLVVGSFDQDQQFIVEDIQRVVLRSQEILKELGGSIAIAGPINKTGHQAGSQGDIKAFEVSVYYPRLSTDLEPACVESDATYPYMERLRGVLTWEPLGSENTSTPRFALKLTLNEIIVSHLKTLIKDITFDQWPLSFQPPSDQPYTPSKANSLLECQGTLTTGDKKVKVLKVRFWAAQNSDSGLNVTINQTLEGRVKEWLRRACEVWYKKGGLSIIPFETIDPKPSVLIPQQKGENATLGDPNYIDVYLVKNLLPTDSNGGECFDCGTPNACIRLDVAKISNNNPYILAHELGHVLGLYHPGDCNPCTEQNPNSVQLQGSLKSVMVPSFPIIERNTKNNIEVTLGWANVLGPPKLESTGNMCQWSPDTQIPDPVIQDIWNSRFDLAANYHDVANNRQRYTNGAKVFNSNKNPTNTDPHNVNDTNYMCIRLCDCLRPKPIRIFFYLGSNQTSPRLRLLPVINHINGPQLIFPATRVEEINQHWFDMRKRTRSVPWTVPNGPENSWIFAIEVPLTVGDVPAALLANLTNFVQIDSSNPANLEALMEQHPNMIGRRLKMPVAL